MPEKSSKEKAVEFLLADKGYPVTEDHPDDAALKYMLDFLTQRTWKCLRFKGLPEDEKNELLQYGVGDYLKDGIGKEDLEAFRKKHYVNLQGHNPECSIKDIKEGVMVLKGMYKDEYIKENHLVKAAFEKAEKHIDEQIAKGGSFVDKAQKSMGYSGILGI